MLKARKSFLAFAGQFQVSLNASDPKAERGAKVSRCKIY